MNDGKCPVTGKTCNARRVYRITEINGDTEFTIKCCRSCAARHIDEQNRKAIMEEYPLLPGAIEFLENLAGSLHELNYTKIIPTETISYEIPIIAETTCPKCRSTMNSILTAGKLGCPECYATFKNEMLQHIKDVQNGKIQHNGKVPSKFFKDLMTAAISNENYEIAAVIRDFLERNQN